jgi:hypothetical protein
MDRPRSRRVVLEDLVRRYDGELRQSWVTGVSEHRVRALLEYLRSARDELAQLNRIEGRGAVAPGDT